eukprot:scaffold273_cov242-Pinguiococcus_pyrenoidosus.AAC.32
MHGTSWARTSCVWKLEPEASPCCPVGSPMVQTLRSLSKASAEPLGTAPEPLGTAPRSQASRFAPTVWQEGQQSLLGGALGKAPPLPKGGEIHLACRCNSLWSQENPGGGPQLSKFPE